MTPTDMTTDTPESEPQFTEPANDPRRLSRPADRVFAGVGAGLAQYFNIDPVLVRVGLVVSLFLGGIGIPLYLILWLVMPSETVEHSSNRSVVFTVGLLFLVVASWFSLGVTDNFGDLGFLLPALMIAGGIALFMRRDEPRSPLEKLGLAPRPSAPSPVPPTTDTTGQLPVVYGAAPATSPPPPPRAADPTPVAADPRSAEPPLGRIVLGLLLLFGAVVAFGEVFDWFEIGTTIALAISLFAVGAAIVTSAFYGRGRGLIPLGIIVGIALAISAFAEPWVRDGIGERSYAPNGEAVDLSYVLGIGELTIDLTGVDYAPTQPVQVSAELGIGELRVEVPDDIEFRVEADGDIGVVDVDGLVESGVGNKLTYETPGVARGDVPDLILHLDLQIGEGTVVITS